MDPIPTPPPLPPRPRDGHKGLFGRVLVVGGNDGMIGAPVLAATAALRLGAGLVQIAVPRSILPYALSITPELIGLALGKQSAKDALLQAAESADSIAIGPGLGQTPEALARLQRLVRLKDKPTVLDADALNLLAATKKWPAYFKARAVLTPHPGEMNRLAQLLPASSPFSAVPQGHVPFPTTDEDRLAIASELAHVTGQLVVLKGARTVVTDGSRYYFNTTGDSSLSKAGTGDVLTGLIACLLAQNLDPFDAASLATHLHGRAGELAGQKLGQRSVLAHDVIASLPETLRQYASPGA
jgi:NAD(P)H-hydrate epimerase